MTLETKQIAMNTHLRICEKFIAFLQWIRCPFGQSNTCMRLFKGTNCSTHIERSRPARSTVLHSITADSCVSFVGKACVFFHFYFTLILIACLPRRRKHRILSGRITYRIELLELCSSSMILDYVVDDVIETCQGS